MNGFNSPLVFIGGLCYTCNTLTWYMNYINLIHTTHSFYCTLTEINLITSGSVLELFNSSTNRSYTVKLPIDSSNYPLRYNLFQITSESISGLTEGIYTYTAKDYTGKVTETGLLNVYSDIVSSSIVDTYHFITGSETSDDYITY